jgi:hypothetical protein
MDFYASVNGDFEQLRKSYDWEWLSIYAFFKRNLSTFAVLLPSLREGMGEGALM